MRAEDYVASLTIAFATIAAACAKPPPPPIDGARQALEGARAAGARRGCPPVE